jgi:hypothetical protein
MHYSYSKEDLFSSTEKINTKKTGAVTPELNENYLKNSIKSSLSYKIGQATKPTRNFGKFLFVAGLIISSLFCFSEVAGAEPKQEPLLGARAESSQVAIQNPLTLTQNDGKGVEVKPAVITELKAESVKSMTAEQKKKALKMLLAEASEETLVEVMK